MTVSNRADPRSELFEGLERAVAQRVFPGCVGLVWRDGDLLYHEAHGRLATHPGSNVVDVPAARDTIYDLASLTKVACTTTLTAIAVERGRMALDERVPPEFERCCPGARLVDLLEHCAGLPAHREYFLEVDLDDPSKPPRHRDAVLAKIAATLPAYPLRARAIYSDLGFMILGAWLERVFEDTLERAFDRHVAQRLGVGDALCFRPLEPAPISGDRARCIAPTEVYDASLHERPPSWFRLRAARRSIAHGEVHDDNAYVMGGVAGHAGLFGSASSLLALARAWLEGGLPGLPGLAGPPDTAPSARFWTLSSVRGSTRRRGWDGQSLDGSGSTAGALDPDAVGHTGYTGTSLWLEPGRQAVYVLLSNRVHPTRADQRIRETRRWFHRVAREL